MLYLHLNTQVAEMKHVTLADAEARFDELIAGVQAGETYEILQDGQVVARLEAPTPKPPIDIDALVRHQASLGGPRENTADALREWKDEAKY